MVWSFGSFLQEEHWEKFDQLVRKVYNKALIPHSDNVFGFKVHNGLWKEWMEGSKEFVWNKKLNFHQIVVDSIDTVRYQSIVKSMINCGKLCYLKGYCL